MLAVLSKLLAWSVTAKYRPAGPNPCQGLEKFAGHKRKRYLDAAEYARLGKTLPGSDIAPGPRTAIELFAAHRLSPAGGRDAAMGACRSPWGRTSLAG